MEVILIKSTVVIVQSYCIVCVEFIVVTTTVDMLNVHVLCVWRLLWLQRQ